MQSPFILETSLKVHFLNYQTNYPKVTDNISYDMYLDDSTSGGNTVGEVEFLNKNVKSYLKKVVLIYTSGILTYRH